MKMVGVPRECFPGPRCGYRQACDRVIVLIMSGKLSFHDWKSQGILLQKTCRNPVLGNFAIESIRDWLGHFHHTSNASG